MEEYDTDLVLDVLALERENEIHIGIPNEPGSFPLNFEDSMV